MPEVPERDHVSERVREACAWVAAEAQQVRTADQRIEEYAAALPAPAPAELDPETELTAGDRETRVAFIVCLDAINFGSGWWPTIRKRPGRSGYFTVAAGLTERFRGRGAWTARELRVLGTNEIATTLGQDPDHPLMADFASALRDVGAQIEYDHGGSFAALVDSAAGSAPVLADTLATWRAFADVSIYGEREVPFLKRAQLAAADLARAGLAELRDLDRLTAFADNLVPHVLRLDGVLELDPRLTARIEAGDLLVHGSPEEVELRACAVHAVELLAAARATAGTAPLTPAEIDAALWNRGREPRYKAVSRPRSRNTAY